MDDTAFRHYFTQPAHPSQRRYEALRAVIVDGLSRKQAAAAFGFRHRTMRQMMYEFRRSVAADGKTTGPPFFKPANEAVRS
jgi:predicted DNA-binding protein (UPF0251 family)